MRGALFGIGVFFASFVGVWALASAAALVLGNLAGVSQAEGAYAMGAIFMIGPVVGLVGALVVTVWAVTRRRRREAGRAAS
jgi:hypothetical protein